MRLYRVIFENIVKSWSGKHFPSKTGNLTQITSKFGVNQRIIKLFNEKMNPLGITRSRDSAVMYEVFNGQVYIESSIFHEL